MKSFRSRIVSLHRFFFGSEAADRVLPLREGDVSVRFVERLNNRVPLYSAFWHWSSAKGLLRFSLYSIASLMLATAAFSQQTIVTAHVQDPRGFDYQAGYGQSSIQCFQNSQPYFNGSPLTRSIPIPALDGTGSFTQTLWDTSTITDTNGAPLSCQWQISIHDHCAVATFSVLVTGVTGSGPVNLSSQINAAAVNLSPACTPPGIVNSVTLGNLPPLFNTSVLGNPLNPSFTFAQIPVAPGTIYGNPSGVSAAPSFNLPSAFGSFGTVSSFSAGTANPFFTTSVATPTTTPALSFVINLQTANCVFAGPTSGGSATPTCRSLVGADLPTPTISTLGGVKSKTAVTHQFFTQLDTTGTFSSAQPTVADISGLGFTQIQAATTPGAGTVCTPPSSSSFDACNFTFTWPTSFADASYIPSCSIGGTSYNTGTPGNNFTNQIYIRSQAAGTMVVTVQNLRGAADTPASVACIGIHP